MRKILILTPFYPPNIGGAETFIKGLVDEAKKIFDITVLTFMPFSGYAPRKEKEYTNKGKLTVIRMNWLFDNGNAWHGVGIKNITNAMPKMLWQSYWLNRKKKFTTIHAQGFISGLVGALIKQPKQKLHITLLAMYKFNFLYRLIGRWIFSKCDKIFVEGEYGKKNVVCLGHENKIVKFTHWGDHNIFTPKKKMTVDKLRILFIGRPISKKGIDIIRECQKKIKTKEVEFEYVTKVEYSKLPEIYRRADILCVPSQYDEGYSRVVVEGALSGCAILTSDRGALPEQVKEFGISVSNAGFCEALEYLISAYPIYGAMSEVYAMKNYTNRNAEVFFNEYRG